MTGANTNADYMGFIGVSTGTSAIMPVFPRWAELLELPTRRLFGHDLPMDASAADYRSLIERIRDDPHHRGALVTTHKMGIFAAAADLFDELDPFALSCGEISSIAKRGDRLIGSALDPITVELALNDFLPPDHFARTGASVVILGAGGAGTALSWALAERADRPERIIVTARDERHLVHLRRVHERRGTPEDLIRYTRIANAADSERAVAAAPPGSLIVNATGLGKDRPGSPLPAGTTLPRHGWIWEFNYRGTLEFLHQARAQQRAQELTVVDGWRYFIHGWSQVIAQVFDIPLTPALVERLAEAAEDVRG